MKCEILKNIFLSFKQELENYHYSILKRIIQLAGKIIPLQLILMIYSLKKINFTAQFYI